MILTLSLVNPSTLPATRAAMPSTVLRFSVAPGRSLTMTLAVVGFLLADKRRRFRPHDMDAGEDDRLDLHDRLGQLRLLGAQEVHVLR